MHQKKLRWSRARRHGAVLKCDEGELQISLELKENSGGALPAKTVILQDPSGSLTEWETSSGVESIVNNKRWRRLVTKVSSAVAVWVTSAAIVVSVMVVGPEASNALVMAPRKLQGDELATVQLFQENTPSVVYITNLAVR